MGKITIIRSGILESEASLLHCLMSVVCGHCQKKHNAMKTNCNCSLTRSFLVVCQQRCSGKAKANNITVPWTTKGKKELP